jgi:AraC-like DNA-binding protein
LNSQAILSQEYRNTFTEKYNLSKDSAKLYSNELINSNKSSIKAFGLSSKGYILTKEGDYSTAKELFNRSFYEIDKIKNTKARLEEKLHVLNHYSYHLLAKHNIEEANKSLSEGLNLSIELDNSVMQITFKNLIGRSFSLLGLGEKAIENGIQTIKTIRSLENKLPESFYNDRLLYAYLNTGNRTLNFFLQDSIKNHTYIDSTRRYLNSATEFLKLRGLKPSVEKRMHILNLNADILYHTKKYNEAIGYYTKSLEIVNAQNLKKRRYQIEFRIAECYFFLGEYEKSKELLDVLTQVDLKQYKLLKNHIVIKYYYAQIFLKQGNPEKALEYTSTFNRELEDYYKKMSNLKVSTFTVNELRAKKEILDQLSIEKKVNNSLSFYLKIAALLIVILIFSVLFYNKKEKKKFKEKIKALTDYTNTIRDNKEVPSIKVNEEKAKKILQKLRDIEKLELFISQEYSLNTIAKKIGSNSAYVSQVINNYWGKSFVQYTNELRINYILIKLKEEKIYQKFTLFAIAESVGYKSLSSFNKHFKIITGISPKQYLNHLKENSNSE